MFKQHRCKHPRRRLFLRGRFLPSRSPNRALLRMNLKTPAPRRQHPPLQNWPNFFREVRCGAKLWMWHTFRNRVWRCSWTSSGPMSGWNCLHTPIWGVLSQIWPNFMQIAISPMLWWHVKLMKKKKTEIQCQRSECNFGCSCWRFWCVCSGGQDYAWDSTAAAINSNTELANKVESTPVRQERWHDFSSSIAHLVHY